MKKAGKFVAAVFVAGSAALAGPLWAAECAADITGTDTMQFDKKVMSVSASCKEFKVTIKHSGKLPRNAMGHNWVLTKTADMQGVANDGIAAGLNNDYVKVGDSRVIAHTKVIGAGETDTITIPLSKLKAGESYTYFCSFPGHSSIMKGVLQVNK